MLAFEDAAALLERARAGAGVDAAAADRRALCELTLLEALAWMRAGDVARGRRGCLRAPPPRPAGWGPATCWRGPRSGYGAELMLAQTDPTLVALLEEALAVLPPGPGGWRAQVLARLAAALQPAVDVQAPMAMAREAMAMAAGHSATPRSCARCWRRPARRWPTTRRRPSAAPSARSWWRLASAAGDRFQVMRAQSRLVFDHLELGALERSTRALDAYEALAREFRQNRHIWPGRLHARDARLGDRSLRRGRAAGRRGSGDGHRGPDRPLHPRHPPRHPRGAVRTGIGAGGGGADRAVAVRPPRLRILRRRHREPPAGAVPGEGRRPRGGAPASGGHPRDEPGPPLRVRDDGDDRRDHRDDRRSRPGGARLRSAGPRRRPHRQLRAGGAELRRSGLRGSGAARVGDGPARRGGGRRSKRRSPPRGQPA